MIEKILQKDFLVKVAAVILALLIWGQVVNEKNPMTTAKFTVDLTFQAPDGKIIQSQTESRVTITFSGRLRNLNHIKAEDLKVPVDISKAPNGLSTVPIVYTSPYPGVQADWTPKTVTVLLAARESKEVVVAVTVRGTPNREYDADKPVFASTSVVVTGAKGVVDRVTSVAGEIDVTGVVGSATAKVPLVAKDAAGNEVTQVEIQPSEIEVTVPMKQKPPAKTVAVKVDTSGSPKNGYKLAGVTVVPDIVEIRGDTEVTRQIDALYTRAIDIAGKDSGFSQTANLIVPTGVTAEVVRVTVNVDIQQDIVTRTFSKVPVQVDNPPIGFKFGGGVSPPEVNVILTGRSDILSEIKASDVQAYIDATEIDPGDVGAKKDYPKIVQLRLQLLPAGIGIQEISPTSVTLTLTKR